MSHSYVSKTATGGYRITGTRVSLDSIVQAWWDGRLPEAIVVDFPSLTLEQVHGAIAYYLANQAEVDRYLAHQDAEWLSFQRESADRLEPLLRRMRQTAKVRAADEGRK